MAAVDMQGAGPALTTAAEAGSSRHQVAELPEGFGYALKRRVLGAPLVTEQLKNERLSRPLALGVLSCDGRSYPPLTGRLLHDHTADRIARQVSRVPGAAATIIPFDVRHKVETIHARREGYRNPLPPADADPIGTLRAPGRAIVQGRLHATEVRPMKHDGNVLACEVADSTGELTAMFYGRAHIAGLEPGRQVRLRGMVGIGDDGRPAMINPAYELLG